MGTAISAVGWLGVGFAAFMLLTTVANSHSGFGMGSVGSLLGSIGSLVGGLITVVGGQVLRAVAASAESQQESLALLRQVHGGYNTYGLGR